MNFQSSLVLSREVSDEDHSFERLYVENVQLGRRFAYRLCAREEDVGDLVQETFLNAFRGYRRFRGDSKSRGGSMPLRRTAARACVGSTWENLLEVLPWRTSTVPMLP